MLIFGKILSHLVVGPRWDSRLLRRMRRYILRMDSRTVVALSIVRIGDWNVLKLRLQEMGYIYEHNEWVHRTGCFMKRTYRMIIESSISSTPSLGFEAKTGGIATVVEARIMLKSESCLCFLL